MAIDFKQDILAPVATDFAAMDKFINEGITSKVALVMAVSKHVVEAGGKRMRPIMCLLFPFLAQNALISFSYRHFDIFIDRISLASRICPLLFLSHGIFG